MFVGNADGGCGVLLLNQFNPVAVWVLDEGDVFCICPVGRCCRHGTRLSEDRGVGGFEQSAGRVDIAAFQRNVAVGVAHGIGPVGPVMRQLNDRAGAFFSVSEKGQCELTLRIALPSHESHTQQRGVEGYGALQVGNPKHGVQQTCGTVGVWRFGGIGHGLCFVRHAKRWLLAARSAATRNWCQPWAAAAPKASLV